MMRIHNRDASYMSTPEYKRYENPAKNVNYFPPSVGRLIIDEGKPISPPVLVLCVCLICTIQNQIVHRYWNVDDPVVWQILEEDLSGILTYLECILACLSKK